MFVLSSIDTNGGATITPPHQRQKQKGDMKSKVPKSLEKESEKVSKNPIQAPRSPQRRQQEDCSGKSTIVSATACGVKSIRPKTGPPRTWRRSSFRRTTDFRVPLTEHHSNAQDRDSLSNAIEKVKTEFLMMQSYELIECISKG